MCPVLPGPGSWRHQLVLVPGEIKVAAVDVILERPDVVIWHVDLDSKYAEILAASPEEVLLLAGQRTLGIDESMSGLATRLRLGLPTDQNWSLITDCSRYTLRIVVYRLPA